MYPSELRYSEKHEWVRVDGDAGTIGITDFAQTELGDIVYVELPEDGAEFSKGDVLGTIESVKAVSEIYAPISGRVVAVNEALTDKPELINSEPHAGGWYCTLRVKDSVELDALMDAAAYTKLTA